MTSDPLDGVDLGALLEHGQPAPELPRPSDPEPMIKTSIKLPQDLYRAVDQEAQRTGIGRSTLIRELVEAGLASRRGQQMLVSLADVQSAVAALALRNNPAA
jgi:predicted transcriptional regulator